MSTVHNEVRLFHETSQGAVYLGDSLEVLEAVLAPGSVDLIVTSPPFGLVREKDYGNVPSEDYVEWFKPFGEAFKRALKQQGSLVIDIGGAWVRGQPTRSLYHFKLLIMLCEELGFHLAQEFYYWNPSKLPTPAEWVTVRRIRVKDAVNCVWWLSPSPWPKASNRRVLQPYSESMKDLLKTGCKAQRRPSGHEISENFSKRNRGAIPPNLLAIPNTESNSHYLQYCREHDIKPHPARFPSTLPEFFVRMVTDPGDTVVDPFAGSCVTGEVCERTRRKWICVDEVEEYLEGAMARFEAEPKPQPMRLRQTHLAQVDSEDVSVSLDDPDNYYSIPKPGLLWGDVKEEPLPEDGGKERPGKD